MDLRRILDEYRAGRRGMPTYAELAQIAYGTAAADQAESGTDELLPCPFCGNALTVKARKSNPYAHCTTEGCKAKQLPLLNIDMPDDIAAWNCRAGQRTTAPEGWKLVPIRPTAAMADAMWDKLREIPRAVHPYRAEAAYRAALAIAPTPGVVEHG